MLTDPVVVMRRCRACQRRVSCCGTSRGAGADVAFASSNGALATLKGLDAFTMECSSLQGAEVLLTCQLEASGSLGEEAFGPQDDVP